MVNCPLMRDRPVGPVALLALGVKGIVGVGIFFVPATIAALAPGHAGILVFAWTALALVPVALVFATLARRFDEDGGPVLFARAAFGELFSFLVGWLAYVSAILSASAVMFGLVSALAPSLGVTGPLAFRLTSAALVTGLALVVASGITISARAWTTLTFLKLLPLVALTGLFLLFGPPFSEAAGTPSPGSLPASSWARAILTALFACQGFEIVPVIAGQVRTPQRWVPFATVGSLVASCSLYVLLMWACVATLPQLATASAPLAEAGSVLGGANFGRLIVAGTSISALGICMGMMVTTPRYLSALAAGQRRLFDLERFAGNGVPLRALIVTWALVMLVVQAGDLSGLFALSSLAVLTQFGVTAAALFTLALRRERGLRPAHALLAVPALTLGLYLATQGATSREGLASLVALLLGFLLFAVAKPRQPEQALRRPSPSPSGRGPSSDGSR
jgi:basic amino acid/polyamine antiporter, APA family